MKARTNQPKHGISFDDAMEFLKIRRIGPHRRRWGTPLPDDRPCCISGPEERADEVIRWISARRATGRSQAVMTKLVRKTLADSPMTPARKRKPAQLAERPDSEIDFSDIPPLNESFWKNAVRNPFYRPVKQQLTVRLDSDVVAWLRRQGRGYQTRLNSVLRAAMLEDVEKSAGSRK
jgi:uncharacterized protein (DUF4415 family)